MLTRPLQLKHPIVLVHGLGAQSRFGPIEYFFGLPKLLREHQNRVLTPHLSAWHTLEVRAQQLKTQIQTSLGDQKVNLVGHSMGGLDIRYLSSCLGFAEQVASITTIGTPHQGTSLGDLAFGLLQESQLQSMDRFFKAMNFNQEAFRPVTQAYCQGPLRELAPKIPGIAYFSATTAIRKPVVLHSLPLFWISHGWLEQREGPNDGFVSVESAQWGEHICTYSGDHYAQIGQLLGRTRGTPYLRFYQEIFLRLKKEGF
ncbi:MAG: esterase/lipase family protein [Bdellovibrionia bacterium]